MPFIDGAIHRSCRSVHDFHGDMFGQYDDPDQLHRLGNG